MKQVSLGIFVVLIATNVYPCIVSTIKNNSTVADILIIRSHIKGLPSDEKGVLIPRRSEKMNEPRVIDAHNLGVGEFLEMQVTEKSSYGLICKAYRIRPDVEKQKVVLEKKDGCQKGWLTYEPIVELVMDDPEDCYLEISLEDDANSLAMRAINFNSKLPRHTRPTEL